MSDTRAVIVKVIRPCGAISMAEVLHVNAKNRITFHMGPIGPIDEGSKGQPFNKVYRNVGRVVFTGRMHNSKHFGKVMEVVEVYSTEPLGNTQPVPDFELMTRERMRVALLAVSMGMVGDQPLTWEVLKNFADGAGARQKDVEDVLAAIKPLLREGQQ